MLSVACSSAADARKLRRDIPRASSEGLSSTLSGQQNSGPADDNTHHVRDRISTSGRCNRLREPRHTRATRKLKTILRAPTPHEFQTSRHGSSFCLNTCRPRLSSHWNKAWRARTLLPPRTRTVTAEEFEQSSMTSMRSFVVPKETSRTAPALPSFSADNSLTDAARENEKGGGGGGGRWQREGKREGGGKRGRERERETATRDTEGFRTYRIACDRHQQGDIVDAGEKRK